MTEDFSRRLVTESYHLNSHFDPGSFMWRAGRPKKHAAFTDILSGARMPLDAALFAIIYGQMKMIASCARKSTVLHRLV
jgi:hypothetical protein